MKIVASLASLSETIKSKLHQLLSFSNFQTSGCYTKDFLFLLRFLEFSQIKCYVKYVFS